MPVDLLLTFNDGSRELHYIPMTLMFNEKPVEFTSIKRRAYEPWKWTQPTYTIETKRKLSDLSVVEIDPTERMADVNAKDNKLVLKW